MKKYLFVILFIGFFNQLQAQDIFDAYQNNEEVTYVSVSPKMFQLLARMTVNSADKEAQEFIQMVSSITNFRVTLFELLGSPSFPFLLRWTYFQKPILENW